ncbi:MAG: hypothetical protein QGG40_00210, partial [Myxococcota bacterium]|nr:hypothetical protein [Myxococcota bacterium]
EQSEWIEHMNLQFPVLRDNHGVVSARYAIDRLPLIMVVDQNGFVFAIGRPDADDPDSLVAELTPLIGSSWEAQQE